MFAAGSQKVRSSLLFDHRLTADHTSDSRRDIEQSVSRMCEMSRDDVRPQLPALFTKFVRQMQGLDTRALRRLYISASSAPCEKAKYIMFMFMTLLMFLPSSFLFAHFFFQPILN